MPYIALTHAEFWKKICIFCSHKAVRIVSNTIVKNTIGDVIKDEKYPEGMCETCRRKANP